MRKLLISALIVGLESTVLFAQKTDDLDLSVLIKPVSESSFMRDQRYFHWCNSIIKDEEGTYHLFYSRWPKTIGFCGWLTHSEIAHAVSTSMSGPYLYKETALKAREGAWDAVTAHNVQVRKFGNQYYMYYTSTNSGKLKIDQEKLDEIGKVGYAHKDWELLRSHQRAGVAVSSSLNGPWKRSEQPLLEPDGPIKNVAVNPSVCQGEDGRYYLIIKGDDKQSAKRKLIQAVGSSLTPDSGFVLEEKPAFADIPTEDVCVWFDKKRERFYAIFHAHGGDFIGLITSEDGLNWKKAKNYYVCKKEVPLKNGSVMQVDNMERPYVYIEGDEVKMISFAVKRGNDSFIVLFPRE